MDDSEQIQSSTPILKPLARRPFLLATNSSGTSTPAESQPLTPSTQEAESRDEAISRTRSIVNLTSSTLFGIYAPSSFETLSSPTTPWGTGAETPVHRSSGDGYPSPRGGLRGSELEEKLLRNGLQNGGMDSGTRSPMSAQKHHVKPSATSIAVRAVLRVALLFGFGLAYGTLVAHLHDDRNVAPVKLDGLNRESWRYLAFWGAASVTMGLLLPQIDAVGVAQEPGSQEKGHDTPRTHGLNGVEWNDVVRSVGAFIGVAYAIRKTPWSSPLQLSATLALVNPFLWYLLDRSSAGLALSSISGVLGVLAILVLNPRWVPSPTPLFANPSSANGTVRHAGGVSDVMEGFFSQERVGLAIWIGSVFFCSCICFGNVGRVLAQRRS